MQIIAAIVREKRQARGWTQQHLADACDVSLRTIQRVEQTGSAAPETVLSLCAVFEISQDEIIQTASLGNLPVPGPLLLMALVALLSMAAGSAFTYFLMQ